VHKASCIAALVHWISKEYADQEFAAMATSPPTASTHCNTCRLRDLCMPLGLNTQQMNLIDRMVSTRVKVVRGQALFRAGSTFKSLYVVRTGFFKTAVSTADGREQVSGFYMGGELMGLDGIGQAHYVCSAIALEDSDVCVLHMDELNTLSQTIPALQWHVQKIMSREIVRDHDLFFLLGSMRAEGRIASFLLNLLTRLHARGQAGDALHLRMTREDIGSYLGLTLETVSRTLSKLVRKGVISLQLKEVRILDLPALHQLGQHADDSDCNHHPLLAMPLAKTRQPLKNMQLV
jgi:CRP/FNR family transcriptional regulator, anaerobic regulatory protein